MLFFSLIESYKKIYTKICLQFWREKMVIGFCDSERACPFLPLELSEHSMIRQIWESDKKKVTDMWIRKRHGLQPRALKVSKEAGNIQCQ